jgi:hypothetical protein
MIINNVNSIWQQTTSAYAVVNVAGVNTWKKIMSGFANINGVWKQIYNSAIIPIEPVTRVTISQSTNATTGIITLTGTNYSWTGPGPRSSTYKFEKSTDNATWSDLTTYAIITEPATGSSNTKTYNLIQANVVANTTNYYRFTVHATAGALFGDSTSTNTTVEGPRNISNLSAANNATTPTTQVDLTWTAPTGAGRQQILYKKASETVWTNFGGVTGTTTSITVAGLTASTSYNFKVVPWTGTVGTVTGSFTGYYGNDSNIATISTAAPTYIFAFGDKISISTNGYISIDNPPTTNTADAVTSTTGTVIAIIPKDLVQSNLYYWSDNTYYKVRWEGYNYGQTSQTQIYEITFTATQSYADVNLITSYNAAGVVGALYLNGVAKTSYPSALVAGSKYRVYFNGTTSPTTITYTPQDVASMKNDTTNNLGDVAQTTLTTASFQNSNSAPVNTVSPVVTPSTGPAGTTTFTSTNGTWTGSPTPTYAYQWQYQDQTTVWLSINLATSSTYTPPSNYVALYGSSLRCRVTATNTVSAVTATSNSVTVSAAAAGPTVTSSTYAPYSGTIGTALTLATGGTVDDGYYVATLPYYITFNGVSTNTINIGTNSYATFGLGNGSTLYSSLSATNPAYNKIMVDAGDRSSNTVWLKTGNFQVSPYYAYFYIHGEFGSSTTPGNAIQWEIYGSEQNIKDLYLTVKTSTNTGVYNISSSTGTIWGTPGAGVVTGNPGTTGLTYKITSQ